MLILFLNSMTYCSLQHDKHIINLDESLRITSLLTDRGGGFLSQKVLMPLDISQIVLMPGGPPPHLWTEGRTETENITLAVCVIRITCQLGIHAGKESHLYDFLESGRPGLPDMPLAISLLVITYLK